MPYPKRTAVLDDWEPPAIEAPAAEEDVAEDPEQPAAPRQYAAPIRVNVPEAPSPARRMRSPERSSAGPSPEFSTGGRRESGGGLISLDELDASWAAAAERDRKEQRRQAAIAESERRRQERESARVAKATDKQNRTTLGQDIEEDPATGAWRQKTDLQGRPLFTKAESDVRYDEKTGAPYQTKRDKLGAVTRVDPDESKPIDRYDLQPAEDKHIYRQREAAPWDAIDPEEGIKSNDGKVRVASAKELHRRELEAAQARVEELRTKRTGLTRLTDEQEARLRATRDGLAATPDEPAPSPGWLGLGGESVEERDARQARAAQRKASLEEIDGQLAAQEERRRLDEELLGATKELETSRAGKVGGFYSRWLEKQKQELAQLPPEGIAAAGEKLSQRGAALEGEARGITEDRAKLEARASAGLTAAQIGEYQAEQANLQARAEKHNATAEQISAEATQLNQVVQGRAAADIRNEALAKRDRTAYFAEIRKNPEFATVADKEEAMHADIEKRAADIKRRHENNPTLFHAAMASLEAEATRQQADLQNERSAAAGRPVRRMEKARDLMLLTRQGEMDDQRTVAEMTDAIANAAGTSTMAGFDGPEDLGVPAAAEQASQSAKAKREQLAAKRKEATDALFADATPEERAQIEAEAAEWKKVVEGKQDVAVVQGMPQFSRDIQDAPDKQKEIIARLATEGKLTPPQVEAGIAAVDATTTAKSRAKLEFVQAQPSYAEKKASGMSDEDIVAEYEDSETGVVAWAGDYLKGVKQGASGQFQMEIDGEKLRQILRSGGTEEERRQAAFAVLEAATKSQQSNPFDNRTALLAGQTMGQPIAQIAQQSGTEWAVRGGSILAAILLRNLNVAKAGQAAAPFLGFAASAYGNANVYGLDYFQTVVQEYLDTAKVKSVAELSPEKQKALFQDATDAFYASQVPSVTEMVEPTMFLKLPKAIRTKMAGRVLDGLINTGAELGQEVFTNEWKEAYMRANATGHQAGAGTQWGDIAAMGLGLLPIGGAKVAYDTLRARREAQQPPSGTATSTPPVEIPGFDPVGGNIDFDDKNTTEVLEAKLQRINEAIPNVADDAKVSALKDAADKISAILSDRGPVTPERLAAAQAGIVDAEIADLDPQEAQHEKFAAMGALKLATGTPFDQLTPEEQQWLGSKDSQGTIRHKDGKLSTPQLERMAAFFPEAHAVITQAMKQQAQAGAMQGGENNGKTQKESSVLAGQKTDQEAEVLGEWTARGRDGTTVSIPLSAAANESQAAEKLAIALGEKRKAEGLDPAGELLDLDSVGQKMTGKPAGQPTAETQSQGSSEVEHLTHNQGVAGSSPAPATSPAPHTRESLSALSAESLRGIAAEMGVDTSVQSGEPTLGGAELVDAILSAQGEGTNSTPEAESVKTAPKPVKNRDRWANEPIPPHAKVISRILQNQGVEPAVAEAFGRHWIEQNPAGLKTEDMRQKAMDDFRALGGRFQGEGAAANYQSDPQPYIAAGHSPEEAAKMVADGEAARAADQQAVAQANATVAESLLNAVDETRQPAETSPDGTGTTQPPAGEGTRGGASGPAAQPGARGGTVLHPRPGEVQRDGELATESGGDRSEQREILQASNSSGRAQAVSRLGELAVSRLEAQGVTFTADPAKPTQAKPNPAGNIVLNFNPEQVLNEAISEKDAKEKDISADPTGKAYGEKSFDEELQHVATYLTMRRKWVVAGRPGEFDTWVSKEGRRMAEELRQTLGNIPANQRREIESAMVAAWNLYYTPYNQPPITSADDVFSLLETTRGGHWEFMAEWARQTRQLQETGKITEQTLREFLLSVAKWMQAALRDLKIFAATIKSKDNALYSTNFARMIRGMEAELRYVRGDGSTLTDEDRAELEGLRQQRQEAADRRKAAQEKQQQQAEAAANVAGEIPPGQRGATGYVLAANKQQIPSAYVLLDDAEVVASHDGQTFAKNPAYPGENTRAYDDPASGEADKVARNAASYLPDLDLSNTPSADSGPPVIARVIREDGTSVYAVVGGNSRRMMRDRLSPDQRAALDRATADAAPGLGFHDFPSPGQGIYRLIGTFDFRESGQREAFQSAVAATNAQETKAQGEAREAQIAAATAVPPESLAGLAFHGEPKAAQDWIAAQVAAGHLNANKLDHLTRPGAEAEAQAFVDRVLAASALRMPALESYLFSEQGRAQPGMPELAQAAIPAMVAMRSKDGDAVADAAARVLANAADYLTNGKAKTLPAALKQAASQLEMGEGAETARILAEAVAARLATNKGGAINAEATGRALSDFFSSIQRGVELLDGEADMFGDVRTVDNVIRDAAGAAQPETLRARRSQKTNGQRILFLQRKAESTRNLTPSEAWELEMLERAEGQQFMPFAGEPTFALDREEAAQENPAAPAENSAQLALFARRSGIPMADDLREQVAEFANRARQAGLPGLNAVPTEVLLSWGAEWRQAHPWDRAAQEAVKPTQARRTAAVGVLRARQSTPTTATLSPTGHEDWAIFTKWDAWKSKGQIKALPIRVLQGKHTGPNSGFGKVHILAEHQNDVPGDIMQFAHNTLLWFNDVYLQPNGRIALLSQRPTAVAVVELREESQGFYSVVTVHPKENPGWKPAGARILGGRKAAFTQSASVPTPTAQGIAGLKPPLEPLVGKDSWEYLRSLSKPVNPLQARRSTTTAGEPDLFTFAAEHYANTVNVSGLTDADLVQAAAKKDLGPTVSQTPAVQTQLAATFQPVDLFGQSLDAQNVTGQAGTEFQPRNIVKGIMSPDFVYKIETSTPVPAGRKLIASKIYERKIRGWHSLWRLNVIENAEGERYSMVENAVDTSGTTTHALTSFNEVSNNDLESPALAVISEAAADQWSEHRKQPSAQTSTEPAAQPELESVAQSAPPAREIEDFGQKIGGARKDRSASIAKDITDDDLAKKTLSEIWPKAEVDAIENPQLAAIAHALRSEVPAKPQKRYKVARWVETVKLVRTLMRHAEERGFDDLLRLMDERNLEQFAAKIRLFASIDRAQWGRIDEVRNYPNAYRYVEDENGKTVIGPDGRMKTEPAGHATAKVDGRLVRADNLTDLAEKVAALTTEQKAASAMKFEVRHYRKEDTYHINKKGDPLTRSLKSFATAKEALAFVRTNQPDLVQAWEDLKERENVKERDLRTEFNRERTGSDRRQGRDVTPEMFQEAFKFRGVEFGLWVSQGGTAKERQGMLNEAFDALHDLAEIIGVPPSAISLNGDLALGFGSRGQGGFAAAHYEPGTIVINLTKTKGAGTLAHEWFHALDHYFQRQRNAGGLHAGRGDYITQAPEDYYESTDGRAHRLPASRYQELLPRNKALETWKRVEGVRPEVAEAFAELVKALDASPMARRASLIDKGKSGGYWSRIIERAARSFENYVIFKMLQKGYHNDYLANVVSPEDFARDVKRYPYLLETEIAPVAEAFDNLFGTIKTRRTDKGMALYARESQKNPIASTQETRQDDNANGPDAQRIRETLAGTRLLPPGRGGLLQAAYADARAGSGAVRQEQGAVSDPIESERQRLVQWALKNKRFKGWRDIAAYGTPDHEGTEHAVFFRDGRVLKVTHDKPVFVADYLERHILHDAAFDDETEIDAVFVRPEGGRLGIVISQPIRVGEHPSEETIARAMDEMGFERTGEADSWRGHGITIADAGPKNWIQDPETQLITPIDLRVFLDKAADALQARQSNREEPVDSAASLPHAYAHGIDALQKAHDRFGRPGHLLRRAAAILEESAQGDIGAGSRAAEDHAIQSLREFLRDAGLLMNPAKVRKHFADYALRGGTEHKVALAGSKVVKDLNAHALATESLFDYITDLQLSNEFFNDALQIEGFYLHGGQLHLITSQPFAKGIHPPLPVMKAKLEAQGLTSESPTGSTGQFLIHDETAGDVSVIDLKPDNVVLDEDNDILWVIDAHFYFDDRAKRRDALQKLGLEDGGQALQARTSNSQAAQDFQDRGLEGFANRVVRTALGQTAGKAKEWTGEQIASALTGTKAGDISEVVWHKVKGQLKNGGNAPEEVAALLREAIIAQDYGGKLATEWAKILDGGGDATLLGVQVPPRMMIPQNKKLLYEALTGARAMDTLPHELQPVAERVRKIIDNLGKRAVQAGLLSKETYERGAGFYLPRLYTPKELESGSIFGLARKVTRMSLDRFKPRLSDAFAIVHGGKPVPHDGTTKGQWRFENAHARDVFYDQLMAREVAKTIRAQGGSEGITEADVLNPDKLPAEMRQRISKAKTRFADQFKKNDPWDAKTLERMGLIDEAAYPVGKAILQLSHDLAMANLFRQIAGNSQWVRKVGVVGYTQMPDTPHWGALAGKWVQDDIAQRLSEVREASGITAEIYDTMLSHWKKWKTVYNPATHGRNVIGNTFFADLAGVAWFDPRNWGYYKQMVQALRGKHEKVPLQELWEDGILSGHWSAQELKNVLAGVDLKDPPKTMLAKLWRNSAGKLGRGAEKLYALEDQIFKVTAYLKARDHGLTRKEAADYVRKWFPDYREVPSSATMKMARRISPFLSFFYEASRIGVVAAQEKPATLVKWAIIPALFTLYSLQRMGIDDDDDKDSVLAAMRGKLFGFPVFSALMPFTDAQGRLVQFDMTNIIPYAQPLGLRLDRSEERNTWWQDLALMLITSNPVGNLLAGAGFNQDPFTGKEWVVPGMSGAEQFGAVAGVAAKTILPPLTPVVGTTWQTLTGPERTRGSLQKRDQGQAVLRGLGGLDFRNAQPPLWNAIERFQRQKGYTEGGGRFGETAVGRSRQRLYQALINNNVDDMARELKYLTTEENIPLRTAPEIRKFIHARHPYLGAGRIKSEDSKAFLAGLSPIERRTLDQEMSEFSRVFAEAPARLGTAWTRADKN
jgi:hypothetical protein